MVPSSHIYGTHEGVVGYWKQNNFKDQLGKGKHLTRKMYKDMRDDFRMVINR